MPTARPGVVSVVLVNFRGTDDTLQAIDHLGKVDWPEERLEIVVVENASGDDSAARIRTAAPHVTLVVSAENQGFAGGCNAGVAASSGEIIALLNNDARPDAGWIRAAMEQFADPGVGAVASKVLDWEGELVDYIGAAMTWYGMGYKPFTGERPPKVPDHRSDVLFGTGSAMFVRRTAYEQLGGFDERYFMFFEDVDLGWRLNLAGWRYVYEPASLAFHKHHASISAFGSFKEAYLLERNALFTLYKNVGEKYLGEALPAAIALATRRAITRGALDSTSFDLRKPGGDAEPTMEVDKGTVAVMFAIDQFVEQLPSLRRSREQIQAQRTVSESRIRRLFGGIDAPVIQQKDYLRGYENLVYSFDLVEVPETTKVVVITGDPIGAKLAGPAIRAWNIAEALSKDNEVVLVSLTGIEAGVEAPFRLTHVAAGDDRAFGPLEKWADVIVFQGHAMAVFDALRRTEKIVVADIYDPMHLEQLEQARELPTEQWERQVREATEVLNEQLERGDFFMAASERQKMFWLGQLAALGRINPATYADDPDLDGLVGVVPFGLSAEPPRHERDVLKGVAEGIGAEDRLLLWSGGLYNWFDPQTLIRAVAELSERRPTVKLFFQGTKHPHPGVPEMAIAAESRALARELGVLDSHVFFNDSWVDFADRQNYLLEADGGVSTHHAHIETTFSFRTRILDYLWAGLPMVVTQGDHFAELVEREGLGRVVPAGDVGALADALEQVLFDEEFAAAARANVRRVREDYRWDRVLAPLVDFVAQSRRAADHVDRAGEARRRTQRRRRRSGLGHDIRLALMYLRTSGPRVVVDKALRRLRR